MKLSFLTIPFLLLLNSFLLSAQEVPKINTFLPKEYNALSQNWDITQDCNGYLFIANTQGILIYNGFKWQLLSCPRNQKPRSVYLGKDCKVYIAGYEFFGYIDITNQAEPKYIAIADSILTGSNQEFWNIFGNSKTIFFQSFSDLFQYNYEQVIKIKTPSNIMLGNSVEENLFLPKIENGVYKINKGKIETIEATLKLPLKSKVVGICASNEPTEYVFATQYDGIYFFEEDKLSKVNSPLNEIFKKNQINKIIRLSSGDYAVGTILDGVYITSDFIFVKHHLNKVKGLSNNTVLALFEDQNFNLWIGLDKGINKIKVNDPIRYYYDSPGLLGSVFTSIIYNNNLFIGSNQGVFRKLKDGNFKLIKNSQGQVWSFSVSDDDLICGHNTGTFIIKDDSAKLISDITGGWCMKNIDDTNILQSTYTGLLILEKYKGNWQIKSRVKNGDILIEIFNISGKKIIGYHSAYGLCVLTLSDDYSEVLDKKFYSEIEGNEVLDDVRIINSAKGIIVSLRQNYYSYSNNSFHKVTQDEISELEKDPKFSLQQSYYKSVFQLSKIENVSNINFNRPYDNSLNFIVGYDEGYIVIPHDITTPFHSESSISIDYVTVNGKITNFKDVKSSIFQAFENDISVQLQKFDMTNIEEKYFYNLENWDDKWLEVPKDGKINFINLQDGTYNLQLKSENNTPFSIYKFNIKPHWYESYVGVIIYISMIFSMFFLIHKGQKRNLRIQKEKLHLEKEKELESAFIKAKNEELLRDVAYKNKMLANSTMTLIQKNEMLIRLKEVIQHESKTQIDQKQLRQKVLHLIDKNMNSDHDWEIFENTFAEVHEDFLATLKEKHPNLTSGELRLAAYIRMNLSSKEIAPLINISLRSIENKRYRLRIKLEISHDDNLKMYLQNL